MNTWKAAPDPGLNDPFRDALLRSGRDLPERMAACAVPMRGEPALDPEEIRRLADAIPLPAGIAWEHPLLERSVRVGLAHVQATFRGDHPKYGTGGYSAPEHDGFPPTIIATVDALTLWGMTQRAEQLFGYWLDRFVRPDGSIDYYGPSLSEYGQLLTTARRLMDRGGSPEWWKRHESPVRRLVTYVMHALPRRPGSELASGSPEADTASDRATYFHNNAWLWRGLRDWSALLEPGNGDSVAARLAADALRPVLASAILDTWPRDAEDGWLRPMVEPESPGPFERPRSRVTDTRLGSYTNYRYWPELLSSGALPKSLMARLVRARLTGGGQYLGMTRFEDHLDDWPLMEYLEGLWALGRRGDFRYCLWGHILYHQAESHLTAYEQVTLPPGRKVADYCLPCQLVAARAARRLVTT